MIGFLAVLLLAWISMIFYFGGGQWGRAQTQKFIERTRRAPRLHAWLDRHHGKFRAASHYIEFGGLTLLLYGTWNAYSGNSVFAWSTPRALGVALVAAVAAFLDELHQLTSNTRRFRFVDYLHSCAGISLALLAIRYLGLWFP